MDRPSRRAYLASLTAGLGTISGCQGLHSRLPGSPRLEAETPALRDADPAIVVRDLEPRSTVRLVAGSDSRFERWQSEATFRADPEGRVRVSEVAPVAGDYTGVDGTGLIWSMSPPGEPIEPWSNEASPSIWLRSRATRLWIGSSSSGGVFRPRSGRSGSPTTRSWVCSQSRISTRPGPVSSSSTARRAPH